jgi:tyrosine-specific transport protein
MTETHSPHISFRKLLSPSFIVAGNVLGVGLLALPIKLGLSGYLPSLLDIIIICAAMIISALVISERLPREKKIFDIPSFFQKEMGTLGRWIAIICNLIILYGIIIAYLSGISTIIHKIIPLDLPRSAITIAYFILATSLVVFGKNVLRKSSTIILIAILICFAILIATGSSHFDIGLMQYANWKFLPLGLPVVISAFHFHNVIPTVSACVHHNKHALHKVILIGVGIGLVMNLTWSSIVLGTLPHATILDAFLHGIPATVPMTFLLNSHLFTVAGLIFAALALTASYIANGAGLYGFIRDMLYSYGKIENKILAGCIAFLPALIFALIYPNIFLAALDIVGGIGEAMLFAVLPGLILMRMMRNKSKIFYGVGFAIFAIGVFVMIFVALEKLGITHLAPTLMA